MFLIKTSDGAGPMLRTSDWHDAACQMVKLPEMKAADREEAE